MCCSCCAPFGAFFRAKFPFLAWPFSDLALFESRPLPLPAYRKKTLGGRGLVFSNSHLRLRAISCPCPKKSPIDHPFSMAHPLRGKPWETHLSLGGSEDLVRDITARTWVCRGAKQLINGLWVTGFQPCNKWILTNLKWVYWMDSNHTWLVVLNMNFIFHFIYGFSSFPLTNSYFSRWLKHVKTTDQIQLGCEIVCFLVIPSGELT